MAPPNWFLVARDAYNGITLWKRKMGSWEWHLREFRHGPPQIRRRAIVLLKVAVGAGGVVEHHGIARVLLEVRHEQVSMGGVGARQRHQDATGGPQTDLALANRLQQITGQSLKQAQPPAHPTDIAIERRGDLAQRMASRQFVDQGGLFDRRIF